MFVEIGLYQMKCSDALPNALRELSLWWTSCREWIGRFLRLSKAEEPEAPLPVPSFAECFLLVGAVMKLRVGDSQTR